MDIKNDRRKIVVNGFITSNSPVKVNISKSRHILDNSPLQFLTDAKVYLLKNGNIVDSLYYTQNGDYFSHNYFPDTGSDYSIKVSSDGLENVEASDLVPSGVQILSIDTATVMYSGSGGGIDNGMREAREMLRCKIKFQDPAGQKNYYQLQIINNSNMPGENYSQYFESDNPVFQDFYTQYGAFFDDEIFDGKNFELIIYIEKQYKYIEKNHQNKLYFILNSVSKNYSLYFRTLENYKQNNGSLFSEPVMVFNNVTNGLGIFAGYSSSKDSLVY